MPQQFHIVDRFDVGWSGSAFHALGTADLLAREALVHLWSERGTPHPCYEGRIITPIGPDSWPEDGTLIIMGGYFDPGPWLESSRPRRLIVKYNTATHRTLFSLLQRCHAAGFPKAELVYPSRWLRDSVAIEGFIEPSPIDTGRFTPALHSKNSPFTVGRLSRDELFKHHEDDLSLYRLLALNGCRVRIMGGTCLVPYQTVDDENIELLPAGIEPAPAFLQSLDVFFYRYKSTWTETFGRVVMEAMACGKPVVVQPPGGYTEWIKHGENGILVSTQEEALEWPLRLRSDPVLAARLGADARRTVEVMYGADARKSAQHYYLGAAP